jgi:hypothetical protein
MTVVVVRVVKVPDVWPGAGTGTAPGTEVDDAGRSLLWKLIWIMGAYRLNAVTDAVCSAPTLLPSHVAVWTTVEVASMVHVWPPILAHP